jgi:hypothetical protein
VRPPNPHVQAIFEEFRTLNSGMLDGSEMENRRFAWLLLQKRKYRDGPDVATATARALIQAAKRDRFHAKNATGFKYLYYNAARIMQSHQSTKAQVHIISGKRTTNTPSERTPTSFHRRNMPRSFR